MVFKVIGVARHGSKLQYSCYYDKFTLLYAVPTMFNPKEFTLAMAFMLGLISCDANDTKLRILAASSLTEPFNQIVETFEAHNPDVNIHVEFAGSQRLRYQLEFGAKADIFASADHRQMAPLITADMLDGPTSDFASNILVLIARAGGPVNAIDDLALPGVKLVLAQEEVPAGEYSRQVLNNLSLNNRSSKDYVLANIVSEEPSVRNVAQKVALGEVDAGIVYRTDVAAAHKTGNINVIEFPMGSNVRATYPIAVLKNSSEKNIAKEFLNFVISESGQSVLDDHGFSSP